MPLIFLFGSMLKRNATYPKNDLWYFPSKISTYFSLVLSLLIPLKFVEETEAKRFGVTCVK